MIHPEQNEQQMDDRHRPIGNDTVIGSNSFDTDRYISNSFFFYQFCFNFSYPPLYVKLTRQDLTASRPSMNIGFQWPPKDLAFICLFSPFKSSLCIC